MPFIVDTVSAPAVGLLAAPPAAVPPDFLEELPPFEQGSFDVQAVMRALAGEFGRLEQARQTLILNFFPRSAEALLDRFEDMLGLPVRPPLTLDQRRGIVTAYMRKLQAHGSGTGWEDAIALIAGPGASYKEHVASDGSTPPPNTVRITLPYSPPATAPAGLALTAGSPGSLPNATYYYAVSAVTGFGETLVCSPRAVTPSGGKVTLNWTNEGAPVISYRIYRGSSAARENLFFLAQPTTNSYVDDGSVALGGSRPAGQNTSGTQLSGVLQTFIRAITPAHIDLEFEYGTGFIVGESLIGINLL